MNPFWHAAYKAAGVGDGKCFFNVVYAWVRGNNLCMTLRFQDRSENKSASWGTYNLARQDSNSFDRCDLHHYILTRRIQAEQ